MTEPTSCAECRHSAVAVGSRAVWLQCRRYPPTLYVDDLGRLCQTFPSADEPCGEHAPHPTTSPPTITLEAPTSGARPHDT